MTSDGASALNGRRSFCSMILKKARDWRNELIEGIVEYPVLARLL